MRFEYLLQKCYRLLSNNELFIGWQAIRIAHVGIAPTNTDLDNSDLAATDSFQSSDNFSYPKNKNAVVSTGGIFGRF